MSELCPHCSRPMPRKVSPEVPEGSAYCRPCDRVLSLSEFAKDRGKKNGHSPRCRDCARVKNETYRDRTQPGRKRYKVTPEGEPKAPPKDRKSVTKAQRKRGIWRGEDGFLYSPEMGGMMLPPEFQK